MISLYLIFVFISIYFMGIKEDWLFNLKIHYIWTFVSSFLLLPPILGLYYLNYGLEIKDIILITAFYNIFVSILEIPTSTLWDTWSRVKVMLLSVISIWIGILIYFFLPFYYMFFVAVFFTALWEALWSWTAHAKLEEDLKAAWKKDEFWKVIGRLIALQRWWSLIAPIVIYFILKLLPPENSYNILAGLDIILWIFVIYFVSKFKEIDKSYQIHTKNLKENLTVQLNTLKNSFKFVFSSKNLILLLLLVILWSDAWFLTSIFLPIIKTWWLADYTSSIFVWIITFFTIFWALYSDTIWKLLWKHRALILLFSLKGLVYLWLFFLWRNIIFSTIWMILVTFFIFASQPIWNTILIEVTKDNSIKSTTRSIFFSFIGIYNYVLLLLIAFVEIKIWFLIISIILLFSGIIIWNMFNLTKDSKSKL